MSLHSAIIAGTGSHVPEKRLTNDDLSKMVETNDEWITQRTGIKERRIAGKDESTASLAVPNVRPMTMNWPSHAWFALNWITTHDTLELVPPGPSSNSGAPVISAVFGATR